jgi:hypothetical protein
MMIARAMPLCWNGAHGPPSLLNTAESKSGLKPRTKLSRRLTPPKPIKVILAQQDFVNDTLPLT